MSRITGRCRWSCSFPLLFSTLDICDSRCQWSCSFPYWTTKEMSRVTDIGCHICLKYWTTKEMSRVTDIGCHHCLKYTQIQKIGKPNNIKAFDINSSCLLLYLNSWTWYIFTILTCHICSNCVMRCKLN
jgi:hypothetical protein